MRWEKIEDGYRSADGQFEAVRVYEILAYNSRRKNKNRRVLGFRLYRIDDGKRLPARGWVGNSTLSHCKDYVKDYVERHS